MELFSTQINKNGNVITKWYYSYYDCNNKKHTRVCKNCNTESEAKKYFSKIQNVDDKYLIANVCKEMYLPGSNHLKRLESFGKNITEETRTQKRQYIELIIKTFGNQPINKIKVRDIEKYLMQDLKHSGSWKNSYLECFGAIYDETIWNCPYPVNRPKFQKFARNSKKADIFTTEELNILFDDSSIWDNYKEYLLFYVAASCGLRLGEARGLQVNQFYIKDQILLVNGFCKKNGIKTNYCKTGSEDNKKYRVVPIPDKALVKLVNYIASRKLKENDYLFLTDEGFIFTQDHLEKKFSRMLAKCKIKKNNRKLVPHSLRFTYVTRMRRNLSVEEVRKIVGHNSIVMTEYYTRPSLSEMKSTVQNALPVANDLFEY